MLQGWLAFAEPVFADWTKVGRGMPQFFWFGGVTGEGDKVLYTMAEMIGLYQRMGANLLYNKYVPMMQEEGEICIHEYFAFLKRSEGEGVPGAL